MYIKEWRDGGAHESYRRWLEMEVERLRKIAPGSVSPNTCKTATCPLVRFKCKHAVLDLRCRARRGHEKQWEECSWREVPVARTVSGNYSHEKEYYMMQEHEQFGQEWIDKMMRENKADLVMRLRRFYVEATPSASTKKVSPKLPLASPCYWCTNCGSDECATCGPGEKWRHYSS